MQVPFARPMLGADERAAVDRVIRSGTLTQGAEISAFEDEFAATMDDLNCVAVSSGTAALHLGLVIAGIGPGDEVIVPSFTFAATANAVVQAGARPVFADIDPRTYCLDPDAVAAVIGPATAAVIAVDLYGHPADFSLISALGARHGLLVMEDACQAQGGAMGGRSAGALGEIGTISFYPSKAITTGEGGMLVCRDPAMAATAKRLRSHGGGESVGFNYRMTDVAAAMGRVQLNRLPEFTERRRDHVRRWDAALPEGLQPFRAPEVVHAWQSYTIRHPERDAARATLAELGVETRVYYETPLHLTPAYEGLDDLPVTEAASREVFSVPVGPHLSADEADRVETALAALGSP